jgi:hypothetical protein
MNWKGCGRSSQSQFEVLDEHLPEGTEENHKKPVRKASLKV